MVLQLCEEPYLANSATKWYKVRLYVTGGLTLLQILYTVMWHTLETTGANTGLSQFYLKGSREFHINTLVVHTRRRES